MDPNHENPLIYPLKDLKTWSLQLIHVSASHWLLLLLLLLFCRLLRRMQILKWLCWRTWGGNVGSQIYISINIEMLWHSSDFLFKTFTSYFVVSLCAFYRWTFWRKRLWMTWRRFNFSFLLERLIDCLRSKIWSLKSEIKSTSESCCLRFKGSVQQFLLNLCVLNCR